MNLKTKPINQPTNQSTNQPTKQTKNQWNVPEYSNQAKGESLGEAIFIFRFPKSGKDKVIMTHL